MFIVSRVEKQRESEKAMKKQGKRIGWLCRLFLLAAMVLFLVPETVVHAGTLYESPYVQFTEDGYGWTVKEALPYTDYIHRYKYPENRPEYWYDTGEKIETGIVSTFRELNEGEHYYDYKRYGEVPVKYWEVKHATGWCIHQCPEDTWHGIVDTEDSCKKAYYSGWFAYCADCEGQITPVLVYMSKDAAASLTSLDVDLGYYYTCPSCAHIENTADKLAHECRQISFNKYKVVYDKNVENPMDVAGFMEPSFHMYNNEDVYRGEPVTPISTLSKNVYTRRGYTFAGWNTKPDGSGTAFEDCAEILNLSVYDCNIDEERGTVTLYAQWEYAESTLRIDPDGGTYEGSADITAVTKRYGETYFADPEKVTPPKGYKVSFHTDGGNAISPMDAEKIFAGWQLAEDFHGAFRNNRYAFLGENGTVDRISATYDLGSIILPTPVKQGKSFGGWFLDSGCTKPVGFGGDRYTPTKSVTLYAKWVDLVLTSDPNYTDNNAKGAVDLSWSQPDNKKKTYKLYESKDGTNFSTIYGAKESTQKKEINKDFAYKGAKEVYTVPYTGFYYLDAYGAQGGGKVGSYAGGRGGNSSGIFYLTAGEQLTVTVGGQNGYNGGGTGRQHGNGGGATTITSNLKGTLIVAGGGGAAGEGGNGGAGGANTSLRADKASNGANGYAGGGGGYVGGNAGEYTVHNHVASCRHAHEGDATSGGACYGPASCGSTSFSKKDGGCYKAYRCDRDNKGNVIYGDRCKGTCHAYCPHKNTTGHCVSNISYQCNQCGAWYSTNPGVCTANFGYALTCGRTTDPICGYIQGQVLSSKPAYGGSNYVNSGYATNISTYAGRRSGNGKASVKEISVGYLGVMSLKGVSAPDLAAPDAIDGRSLSFKADGESAVQVSFEEPKDNGTQYWYRVNSYQETDGTQLCISNITTETLTTGVVGYYYILNTTPTQTVTAKSAQNKGNLLTSTTIRVLMKEGTRYLHVAAVDKAGNVGPTTNIALSYDELTQSGALTGNLATDPIEVTDVINGKDNETVYRKDDKTYYVRADGKGAFMLSFRSFLYGKATQNHQVDYQIFDVNITGENKQRYSTRIPYCVPVSDQNNLPVSEFVREMKGDSILKDAMNTGAYRKRNALDNYFYQAFTIPKSFHGKSMVVTPVAGTTTGNGITYSDWDKDVLNAVTLIADGEAPDILGTSVLEGRDTINREDGPITLDINATDDLSGVGSLEMVITNLDSTEKRTYTPDATGHIKVDITQGNSFFGGNLCIKIVSTDNVGNTRTLEYGATEFTLEAEIERILAPHTPIFKCGESGFLKITTWGYAERIEVEFPAEFVEQNTELNKTYSYIDFPQYKREELVQFMVPLNVTPGKQYIITVRAYKGNELLEEQPCLCTVAVEGSVLDEFRTRLR